VLIDTPMSLAMRFRMPTMTSSTVPITNALSPSAASAQRLLERPGTALMAITANRLGRNQDVTAA
jgi:hypothetical protein